ncbi:hypothetical protein C1645_542975 [Glomus cerebriforme]|uniref:Uncharacterized protein n=1 Tax=Glomus cerebriforme TaxID=658196 RepID=A0A397TA04_9GLOM|nr:hypothetical protein C1645_542975 [Glomus cerebriforme]
MPDFSSLQKSSLNFTGFSPKNDRELTEARTKIKSLEISKDNLDLKVSRIEAENKNLELKNRELCLQIEGLEKDKDFYYNREKDALKSLENLELENMKLKPVKLKHLKIKYVNYNRIWMILKLKILLKKMICRVKYKQ